MYLDPGQQNLIGKKAWKRQIVEGEKWEFMLAEGEETVRKLLLTGGLIFLKPATANQIVVSMLMCLGSIRTYAHYNPFVDPKTDIIAEIALWSLFFVMFGALLIKVNMDNESLQNRASTRSLWW
ncbi:hypothetical protein TrLO_g709 [Triparma laevis f. longispina]|uniref:Uncharacterized protein n=1 Tax=Triparma laevis f. longispina TaxID=1714387 RepID=A0A9W7ARN1_9STRA|nr:hypothetical protein TrLO_g709 [Triparma laevis f. longispina]